MRDNRSVCFVWYRRRRCRILENVSNSYFSYDCYAVPVVLGIKLKSLRLHKIIIIIYEILTIIVYCMAFPRNVRFKI